MRSRSKEPPSYSSLLRAVAAVMGMADVSLEQEFQQANMEMQKEVDDMRLFLCKKLYCCNKLQCACSSLCVWQPDHCHSSLLTLKMHKQHILLR